MMRFLLMLFMLFPFCTQAIVEGDLLEPQQAFKFSAKALDADTIEVRYQVAEGYHLYRDKLKFDISPADVTLGPLQLPPGKVEQDEIFDLPGIVSRKKQLIPYLTSILKEMAADGALPVSSRAPFKKKR